jgi:hypothetical protein
MFLGIKFEGWLTIIAIIAGPLLAFEVQRRRDAHRERRNRKLAIFQKLMMTLKVPLNTNHVDAINSIQVEFYAKKGPDKRVIDAWRLYTSHLNQPHKTGDELVRWAEKKFDLLVELVYLMGQSLGYDDIDRVAIRDNTYVPRGYSDVEGEWQQIRKAWLDVLNGMRALPMTMVGPVQVEEPMKPAEEVVLPARPQAAPPLLPAAEPREERSPV